MGTATSIGGPPMAMVWQRLGGVRLRATTGAFFLVGSLRSPAAPTAAGAVGAHPLRHTAPLAPAALTVAVAGAAVLVAQ
jgi:hypothetical protein